MCVRWINIEDTTSKCSVTVNEVTQSEHRATKKNRDLNHPQQRHSKVNPHLTEIHSSHS